MSYEFPQGFIWGVAAASAQIEGAAWEDGKGESIWDRFSRRPGAVINGDTPDVACDHYHRYEADADLMASLGIKNYRLSIAWPRILPNGTGEVNEAGLAFYDRLIDAFIERDITPWITMFHWDLPQALEDEDGWLNRKTVDAFAVYADIITKRYGDRVKHWFTLNEMPCFIGLGYETGIHAPGRQESRKAVHQGYHHALLCHGIGVNAVRKNVPGGVVGLVNNPVTLVPVIETQEHIDAALKLHEKINGGLMGPIYRGEYPAAWLAAAGDDIPEMEDGDMAIINQPGDFLGLNLYSASFVRAGDEEPLPFPKQFPQGDLPWINIVPQTLYWQIRATAQNFGVKSFFITENGSAFADELTAAGEVLDLERRELLRNYLIGLHRASAEGYDVQGYFAWSVMDNYEWAEGYVKRFGLIYVDYETQKRTPKLSAQWYSAVAQANRIL